MEKILQEDNKYSGITKFHQCGIKGKGIVIWNTEAGDEHSEITRRRIKDAAPEATILNARLSMRINNEEILEEHAEYEGKKYPIEEFIGKYNVKIITRSKEGRLISRECQYKFWENLKTKYNLIILNAAGNDGYSSERYDDPVALLIGACIVTESGDVMRAHYSSVSGGVDFVDSSGGWGGTSFSTPYLAGKVALLLELCGDISQCEMVDKLKELASNRNWDEETGWGMVILPDITERGNDMNVFYFSSLPTDGKLRITSGFGYRNTGIKGASNFHRGIDIGADKSKNETKILSVAAGTVVKNFWHDVSGWVIMIKHNDRYTTRYQHMKHQSPLKVGMSVSAAQVIGVMGNTSKTIKNMGVHLHMELHDNGMPVDFIDKLQNIKKGGDDMTRDETAALIKELIAAERAKEEPAASWATSDIAEAKRAGITDGTRPTALITRQEVVVMIMRAIRHLKEVFKR